MEEVESLLRENNTKKLSEISIYTDMESLGDFVSLFHTVEGETVSQETSGELFFDNCNLCLEIDGMEISLAFDDKERMIEIRDFLNEVIRRIEKTEELREEGFR